MFKKLRRNMVLVNMAIITIVIFVSFIVIFILTSTNINSENQKKLEGFKFSLFTNIRNPYEENNFILNNASSFSLFLDSDKNLSNISSSLEVDDDSYFEIIEKINLNINEFSKIEFNDSLWLYQITELSDRDQERGLYYKISFLDITASNDAINTLLIILIFTFLAILVVIYFISLYFAKKAVKPLEQSFLKQKQFIADATHELKTPITIINANIDAIKLNSNESVRKQERWLNHIKIETNAMNKLITELLNSAHLIEEKIKLSPVNLSLAINEYITVLEASIFEKQIKLNLDIDNNIKLVTNEDKLLQVFKILVDNATKYNKENGFINIQLYKEKKHIYLVVENSGERIKKEDINHIFDRFYKVDKSRSDNSFGLGLPIALSIITKLNGTITVSSTDEKTTFIIKI